MSKVFSELTNEEVIEILINPDSNEDKENLYFEFFDPDEWKKTIYEEEIQNTSDKEIYMSKHKNIITLCCENNKYKLLNKILMKVNKNKSDCLFKVLSIFTGEIEDLDEEVIEMIKLVFKNNIHLIFFKSLFKNFEEKKKSFLVYFIEYCFAEKNDPKYLQLIKEFYTMIFDKPYLLEFENFIDILKIIIYKEEHLMVKILDLTILEFIINRDPESAFFFFEKYCDIQTWESKSGIDAIKIISKIGKENFLKQVLNHDNSCIFDCLIQLKKYNILNPPLEDNNNNNNNNKKMIQKKRKSYSSDNNELLDLKKQKTK